ncbi:MAG: aminopeptidase P family protein [Thermodesulfobacteriota bacterium]
MTAAGPRLVVTLSRLPKGAARQEVAAGVAAWLAASHLPGQPAPPGGAWQLVLPLAGADPLMLVADLRDRLDGLPVGLAFQILDQAAAPALPRPSRRPSIMADSPPVAPRLALLVRRLRRLHLDALLVSQPENRFYLSGFAGHDTSPAETSGLLLVPVGRQAILVTDFRYRLDAERQATGCVVRLGKGGMPRLLAGILPRLGLARLAFESQAVLHSQWQALGRLAARSDTELVPRKDLVEALRIRKDAGELAAIERAVRLNEAVFQEVFQALTPGMTERQVAEMIETGFRRHGADGPSFPPIVAGGANGASPHAQPGDRPLAAGEPIVIDMGCRLDGYCSDMTRTVVLGEMDELTRQRIRLVRRAQLAALAVIRPGVRACDVDRAARAVIEAEGLGPLFGHGLGHGVGLAVHEAPAVNRRSLVRLAAGMVVTVEPGIYFPGWGGIRLENMVQVTGNGVRLLNKDTTFLDV